MPPDPVCPSLRAVYARMQTESMGFLCPDGCLCSELPVQETDFSIRLPATGISVLKFQTIRI